MLAILLLHIAGGPRRPTVSYAKNLFTNAGRGTRNLVDYYDEVSHGRVDLGPSKVFGWMNYHHTVAELHDEADRARLVKLEDLLFAGVSSEKAQEQAGVHRNNFQRQKIVEWGKEAFEAHKSAVNAKSPGAPTITDNLSDFAGVVYLFDVGLDYAGGKGLAIINWNPPPTNWPAFHVELSGVSHEVGHCLGLPDSYGEGPDGPFNDPYDVMSVYGTFSQQTFSTRRGKGAKPHYFWAGPGLNAVNMEMMGWLDSARVTNDRGGLLRLRPLHRRDLPGWLAGRIRIGLGTYYIEFRLKELWDKAIPASCILLHQRSVDPTSGAVSSELVITKPNAPGGKRADLLQGESFELGEPNDPFGFYARITVVKIDEKAREAQVQIYVRQAREFGISARTLGATPNGGPELYHVPGRGFFRIPPRSPLVNVLATLAEYEALQETNGGEHARDLEAERIGKLVRMRDQLTHIIEARLAPKVPAPSSITRKKKSPPAPRARKGNTGRAGGG